MKRTKEQIEKTKAESKRTPGKRRTIGRPLRTEPTERLTVYMPEGMAPKKIMKLEALGAQIVQTPRSEYTSGARARAQAYYNEDPETRWFLNQAKNHGNLEAHKELAHHLKDVEHLAMITKTCAEVHLQYIVLTEQC